MDPTRLEPTTTRLEASRIRPLNHVGHTNLFNNITTHLLSFLSGLRMEFRRGNSILCLQAEFYGLTQLISIILFLANVGKQGPYSPTIIFKNLLFLTSQSTTVAITPWRHINKCMPTKLMSVKTTRQKWHTTYVCGGSDQQGNLMLSLGPHDAQRGVV